MDKQRAVEVLQALATDPSRSDAARFRDIYNEVEAALSAGASREKVFEALKGMGFKWTTLRAFDTTLYRLRKKGEKPSTTFTALQKKPSIVAPEIANVKETTSINNPEEVSINTTSKVLPSMPEIVKTEPTAGKTLTEHVLNSEPKYFSLKQLQKRKETK